MNSKSSSDIIMSKPKLLRDPQPSPASARAEGDAAP
jgi:hypothetical protein